MEADLLFRLDGARRDDERVSAWFAVGDPLRGLIDPWFGRLRACGTDVDVLIHDGNPTACVAGAAFAYVAAFGAYAAAGFFHGAALPDPARLLEGTGRRMRHVKLHPGRALDEPALATLIAAAYRDIRSRLADAAG